MFAPGGEDSDEDLDCVNAGETRHLAGRRPAGSHERDFTAVVSLSTMACGHRGAGCTFAHDYSRVLNPPACLTRPGSVLCIDWPVTSLTLGGVSYTVDELVAILNAPASGNGLLELAHQ